MQPEHINNRHNKLKQLIIQQSQFLNQQSWLINLPVIDSLLDPQHWQHIKNKIQLIHLKYIRNKAIQLSDLSIIRPYKIMQNYKYHQTNCKGRSQKKQYQIQIFTQFIKQTLINKAHQLAVVDVGCGQGHLCQQLENIFMKHNNKISIVGIDNNQILIKTANQQKPNNSTTQYQCVNFDDNWDFKKLNQKQKVDNIAQIKDNIVDYSLISLHGCGLLFESIVNNFLNFSKCQYFASISCCYNLIPTQKFHLHSSISQQSLSPNISPRCLLTIACQNPDTWDITPNKKQNFHKNIIFRTILQKILYDHKVSVERLGKVNTKNVHTLKDYLILVTKSKEIGLKLGQVNMQKYEQIYEQESAIIQKIWDIRGWVGLVAQRFLVIDRALWLEQQSGVQFEVLQIFQRKMSARNVCIVGWKRQEPSL